MEQTTKQVQIIKPIKLTEDAQKLRVAAYCRVSTDSKDQQNSFFTQIKYYNDYIRRNENMIFVDVYADEGITGTEMKKRDEFKRLMKDCKNRKIDRVLVKSVTRFARNSLECIETVRVLKSYGASVYFENDNIDTERMNSEMMLYIKSAFAQSEALSASRRMSVSARMRMENGTYKSNAPRGYHSGEDGWVIDEEESKIIKEIFGLYMQGYGLLVIAKHLQGKYGGNWCKESVRYILSNEKYIGDCLMQKTYTPQELPLRDRRNRGELPKYYMENAHEAIIERQDFAQAQELMKERTKKHYKRIDAPKPFLYQKIKCRKCGWSYKSLKRDGQLFWTCSRKGFTLEVCHSLTYSDMEIRKAFVKMFNTLKDNQGVVLDETIAQLQTLKVRVNRGNNEIAEIDAEVASLGEQNSVYHGLYVDNIIDEIMYREKTDKLKYKIAELRDRRMKLINEDDDERCMEYLRHIKRVVSASERYMSEMDESIFTEIVEVIYAEADGRLTFRLKGELELSVCVR